jgi:hypothetical protein
MPIVRRTWADIDKAKLLAELAARPQPSEDEIEAPAIEDGDGWTDEELAGAEPIYRRRRRTRFVPSGRGWGVGRP